MTERAIEVPPQPPLPEVLRNKHTYGVVIPYSSNLREQEKSAGVDFEGKTAKGDARLSFYSAAALNTALEMYRDGKFDKIILLSDATFGEERKSTGLLMKEALLRLGSEEREKHPKFRPLEEANIILLDAIVLNNTPAQVKALTEYQNQNNLQGPMLLIDWAFHDKRIHSYMEGFDLKADTVTVEDAHKYYNPSFKLEELQRILPTAFEEREKKTRMLARFVDNRGYIPRFLKLFTGSVVTDIKKVPSADETSPQGKDFHLELDNTAGKEKVREQEERTQT